MFLSPFSLFSNSHNRKWTEQCTKPILMLLNCHPDDLRDDPHSAQGPGRRNGDLAGHGPLFLRTLYSILGELTPDLWVDSQRELPNLLLGTTRSNGIKRLLQSNSLFN